MPVADVNEAVLQAVEEHALTPEAIELVIHLSEREDVRDQRVTLERERKDIEKRITRIVAAIETGAAMSLVAKLRELEASRLPSMASWPRYGPSRDCPKSVLENRLAEWRRLLRASTTQARTVLQRILRGRLTFTLHVNPVSHEIDGYEFEGPTRVDKLFTGIAVEWSGQSGWLRATLPGASISGWRTAWTGTTGGSSTGFTRKEVTSPAGTSASQCLPIRGISDLAA